MLMYNADCLNEVGFQILKILIPLQINIRARKKNPKINTSYSMTYRLHHDLLNMLKMFRAGNIISAMYQAKPVSHLHTLLLPIA